MQKLESKIESEVVKWAKDRNIAVLKFTPHGQRGWPDRLFLLDGGRPVFIEFKRHGKRPRMLQQYYIGILEDLGYDVCYCDTAKDAIKFIERCVKSQQQRICAFKPACAPRISKARG